MIKTIQEALDIRSSVSIHSNTTHAADATHTISFDITDGALGEAPIAAVLSSSETSKPVDFLASCQTSHIQPIHLL